MINEKIKKQIEKMRVFSDIESGEILNLSSDQIRLKTHSYRLHNRKAIKKDRPIEAEVYLLISILCSRVYLLKSISENLNKNLEYIGSQGKAQIKLGEHSSLVSG